QSEVELGTLDQFENFRERGIKSEEETGRWMRESSEILLAPPETALLRVETPKGACAGSESLPAGASADTPARTCRRRSRPSPSAYRRAAAPITTQVTMPIT